MSIGHSEVFLRMVNHFARTRMDDPETNLRSRKTMSVNRLMKRLLNHWSSQMLDRLTQDGS